MSKDYKVNNDGSVTRSDGDYSVNNDGSVTRKGTGYSGNNDPSGDNRTPEGNNQSSNNNSGCFWIVFIIGIVIGFIAVLAKGCSGSSYSSNENDSINDIEIIEIPVSEYSAPAQSSLQNSSQIISDNCSWRRMDNDFNGYILVPDFCKYSSIDNNGWLKYYADNGSYIISTILEYEGSAYEVIDLISKGTKITYSAEKSNWAVKSGFSGDYIYYMKAIKYGNRIYTASFYVPKNDKTNSLVYTRLTERIFNSSNFPNL